MLRIVAVLIVALGLAGCASHTQFGGDTFGFTFGWGPGGSHSSPDYSYQDPYQPLY